MLKVRSVFTTDLVRLLWEVTIRKLLTKSIVS